MKAELRMQGAAFLTHPILALRGIEHGFGLRTSPEPPRLLRVRQVHGCAVAVVRDAAAGALGDADALVSAVPQSALAVATADCVPVLASAGAGRVVAAIHAGWRGLAAGVVGEALAALRREAQHVGADDADLVAAIGPHIGACCYEVDEPVLTALRRRFGAALDASIASAAGASGSATRPGHALLDLAALTRVDLMHAGVPAAALGVLEHACTRCDRARFHSFRRDGAAAGRLLHWIRAGPALRAQG
jgi:YfiH family protein